MEFKNFTNMYDGSTWINKDYLIKRINQIVEWSIPEGREKDFVEMFNEFMDECKYKD